MLAAPSSHKGRNSTIFAFTPRQVLLSNHTMGLSADNGTISLKRQQKLLLHQSIAHYLDRSGFSKTLKKFRSEAQIEKDDLEGSPFDLEEMCLKYLEVCGKNTKSNMKDNNDGVADVHSKNKEEGKSKEKKKKKSKLVSESDNIEENQLESPTLVKENKVKHDACTDAKVNGADTEKRSKDKVKKKDKTSSDWDAKELTGDFNDTVSEKEISKGSNKEVIHEKKDSKKRKRSISEENGQNVSDIKADEETKRKKVKNSNESNKGGEQSVKTNGNLRSDLNSNGNTNGNLEDTGGKSSAQKSQKKQDGSVEQKSAKTAFQRVQVDKVEFADERLQDNSYWAKHGAETGYGAKAEEILGQVRGRDFRHEKTKKKRGTYRGGQIDLQSHSIKFNYSDED